MADPDDDIARAGAGIALALWWYQQAAYRVPGLISLGEQLLATGERLDDRVITMEGHAHIATGLYLKGDWAACIQHHEWHLRLARLLGDRFNEQRAHGNLAGTLMKWDRCSDALEHALAQRVIARDIASGPGERYALLVAGRAYTGLGRFKEAAITLDEGAALADQAGDSLRQVEFTVARGLVLIELGERESALALLSEVLEPARATGMKMTEVNCVVLLARAHRLLGRTREAMRYSIEALVLAEQMGSPYWIREATREREAATGQRSVTA
ncbi:hypothetical protein ACFQQB_45935 [Nonomuraea rubra]